MPFLMVSTHTLVLDSSLVGEKHIVVSSRLQPLLLLPTLDRTASSAGSLINYARDSAAAAQSR